MRVTLEAGSRRRVEPARERNRTGPPLLRLALPLNHPRRPRIAMPGESSVGDFSRKPLPWTTPCGFATRRLRPETMNGGTRSMPGRTFICSLAGALRHPNPPFPTPLPSHRPSTTTTTFSRQPGSIGQVRFHPEKEQVLH